MSQEKKNNGRYLHIARGLSGFLFFSVSPLLMYFTHYIVSLSFQTEENTPLALYRIIIIYLFIIYRAKVH